MKKWTYENAVDFLFGRSARGMKLGLENMTRLLEKLGHPEKATPAVHVAGTNGKGSTSAIMAAILESAGYRTGLYTSPHLIDMRERILVNGEPISQEAVLSILQTTLDAIETSNASFFEILTAMAFLHFSRQKADAAVLETGLGGRLDATNLVTPALSIITEIGLDHIKTLGGTLKAITWEKAGILKPGVPCVCGTALPDVREYLTRFAWEKDAPLSFARDHVELSRIRCTQEGTFFDARLDGRNLPDLKLALLGAHQAENARTALEGVSVLRQSGWAISDEAVANGLAQVKWRGRLELVPGPPRFLVDAAHNAMGIETLARALETFMEYDRLILLFGVLADKDYSTMFGRLAGLADHLVLSRPLSDRALEPTELAQLPGVAGTSLEIVPDIQEAVNRSRQWAGPRDLICAAGSIYFIGDVLRTLDLSI